jgi:hypothetical protein
VDSNSVTIKKAGAKDLKHNITAGLYHGNNKLISSNKSAATLPLLFLQTSELNIKNVNCMELAVGRFQWRD